MLNQLKANLGKHVEIELNNGSHIFGTILEVGEKILRMETEEGVASLFVDAVQVIWELQEPVLSDADMDEIVKKVKDLTDARYVCLGYNGFRCPQNYTCRPPHACNRFFCPGYFSGFVPPPPPDQPCVTQFYGLVRKEDDGNENNGKDK